MKRPRLRRGSGSESPWRSEESTSKRDVVAIVLALGVIAIFQVATHSAPQVAPVHLLYRKLFYVPIMYAGFVFGWRGGLAVAVAASLLLAPHIDSSVSGAIGSGVDNLYEIVMYVAIGLLFGWLRDLEERKAADLRQVSQQLEEAYSTLEERAIQLVNIQDYTQAILRSITAGVLTVGPDGSVTTVNLAAERMMGMQEADMVPRRLDALFLDDGGIELGVQRILSGSIPKLALEVQAVTETGRSLHAKVAMSRMRDVEGCVLGVVVTLEDVSEVRALTNQLIRADRLAAMGELTAGVAHEVRNPLGIIRASVQLVEDSNSDPVRVQSATRVIKQEIDRLDKVIKALLDFGRPSAPTLRPVKVQDIVADVVMLATQFAVQAEAQIVVEYAQDVSPVIADADQLKQVFVNLVSNAVQAMESPGGTISLRVWEEDASVFVSIADTGPGMDPEALGKVFDPFFSTKEGGTGLGLTIVHRIIDQHGGRIEVSSTIGEGTTFTVVLPAAPTGEGDR
ncbi:MAG: PAS domain-containing protein [Coriobacteriia bacterium]|nr:PAS domain-containing protein [Coriobacteriia bacterium]